MHQHLLRNSFPVITFTTQNPSTEKASKINILANSISLISIHKKYKTTKYDIDRPLQSPFTPSIKLKELPAILIPKTVKTIDKKGTLKILFNKAIFTFSK